MACLTERLPSGAIVALLALGLAAACGGPAGERMRAVDLLQHEASAEKRPEGGRFVIRDVTCGGVPRTALAVPPVSRVIWPLALPARSALVTALAIQGEPESAVTFRVGISDDRIYDALESIHVAADDCGRAWVPLSVDLGRYGGIKFSIFYQPDRRDWRLVLATNVDRGDVEEAYWVRPGIETDEAAAKEYLERITRKGRRR